MCRERVYITGTAERGAEGSLEEVCLTFLLIVWFLKRLQCSTYSREGSHVPHGLYIAHFGIMMKEEQRLLPKDDVHPARPARQ